MDYQNKSHQELIIKFESIKQKYDELKALYEKEMHYHSKLKEDFIHSENRYRDLVENMNVIIWQF